jgi:hypothetical protein
VVHGGGGERGVGVARGSKPFFESVEQAHQLIDTRQWPVAAHGSATSLHRV